MSFDEIMLSSMSSLECIAMFWNMHGYSAAMKFNFMPCTQKLALSDCGLKFNDRLKITFMSQWSDYLRSK